MRVAVAIRRTLVAVAVAVVGLLGTVGPAAAAPGVPYTDSSADGYLGICNQQAQQITSGSIDSAPFAWEAVSSVAAPSAVSGSGRTATLYAYQPIQGEEAGDWSGEQITGTSQYTNPSYPMAVSTARDFSLSQFLDTFAPKWDGFIELRMFLGAPGVEPQVLSYPALSLYISGDTWQAVGGGSVDCTAGQARSDEVIVPTTTAGNGGSGSKSSSSSSTGHISDTGSSSQHGHSGTGRSSSPGARGGGVTPAAKARPVLAVSNSSNTVPVVLSTAGAVILIAIAAWIVIRSRRRRLAT
jgi:hypothetical protein